MCPHDRAERTVAVSGLGLAGSVFSEILVQSLSAPIATRSQASSEQPIMTPIREINAGEGCGITLVNLNARLQLLGLVAMNPAIPMAFAAPTIMEALKARLSQGRG